MSELLPFSLTYYSDCTTFNNGLLLSIHMYVTITLPHIKAESVLTEVLAVLLELCSRTPISIGRQEFTEVSVRFVFTTHISILTPFYKSHHGDDRIYGEIVLSSIFTS
jgi:hypothetical protein